MPVLAVGFQVEGGGSGEVVKNYSLDPVVQPFVVCGCLCGSQIYAVC